MACCHQKKNKESNLSRWILALLPFLLIGTSHAQVTPFEALVVSESGDYIGDGQTYHLVSSAAGDVQQPALDPIGLGPGVDIRFTKEGFWQFKFAPAVGTQLQVGSYENAVRQISASGAHPGMDISGRGHGCNQLIGRFDVWDVAYGTDGRVERLAVDAVQYCESSARALRVYLRYGATTVPLQVPRTAARAGADRVVAPGTTVSLDGSHSTALDGGALTYSWTQVGGTPRTLSDAHSATPSFTASAPVAEWQALEWRLDVEDSQGRRASDFLTVIVSENTTPRSEVRLVSQPFEPVGQGQVIQQVLDLSKVQLKRNFYNGISLDTKVQGNTSLVDFSLDLAAPRKSEIGIDNYPLAFRYPFFSGSGKSGLDATLVLGCNQSVSHFVVHDVAYDDQGAVDRLAVDFTQICLDDNGALLPLLGYVRINSVVPIQSRAPTTSAGLDLLVEPRDAVSLDGSDSVGGGSEISSYEWTQIDGPAVTLSAPRRPGPQFAAPDVPPTGAVLKFRLTVTNVAGFATSDTVSIHVRGSAEPRSVAYLEPTAADFPTGGSPLWFDENIGTFTISPYAASGQEQLTVNFDDITFSSFTFRSPAGAMLEPGVYPATDTYVQDEPGFSFSSDGRGCNQTVGSMTIHEIERDTDGNVIRLAADFVYQCDYGSPVYGLLRFNSAVPLVAPTLRASAGVPQRAAGGDGVQLDAGLSYPGAGDITNFSWRQISGPAVTLTSTHGARVNFIAPASGGVLEFEVTVTTSDGQSGSSVVRIDSTAAGTPRTLLVLDPGGSVGLSFGRTVRVESEPGSWQIRSDTGNGLQLGLYAPHNMNLMLFAPFQQPLTAGVAYEGTRIYGSRFARQSLNTPGMDFDLDGQGCLMPRGRFQILELVRNSAGVIARLAVDFQQICGNSGSYIRAALRINSAVPVRSLSPLASAGPDLLASSATTLALDGRASAGGMEGNTTYLWKQVSGPAFTFSASSASEAQAFVTPPTLANGTAEAVFSLTVTNSAGVATTDTTKVTLVGTAQPRSKVFASRYQPGNTVSNHDWTLDENNSYATVSIGSQDMSIHFANDFGMGASFHLDSPATRFSPGFFAVGPADFQFKLQADADVLCFYFEVQGALRISSVVYEEDTLKSMAFDFDVHCGTLWGYAGSLRFNAADPIEPGRAFVDAGPDITVNEGTEVKLDARKALVIGTPATQVIWTQVAGPSVALAVGAGGIYAFTAPPVTSSTALRFRLTVIGAGQNSATDEVSIIVNDVSSGGGSSGGGSSSSGSSGGGNGGGSGGGGGALDALTAALMLALSCSAWRRARQRRRA
jgi:uncharacterized membrane protein YgcG